MPYFWLVVPHRRRQGQDLLEGREAHKQPHKQAAPPPAADVDDSGRKLHSKGHDYAYLRRWLRERNTTLASLAKTPNCRSASAVITGA